MEEACNYARQHSLAMLVYGAGRVSRWILHQLEEYGMDIHGVVVSDKQGNPESFLGHKVSVIDEFRKDAQHYLVYIATDKYFGEIKSKLQQMGFEHII